MMFLTFKIGTTSLLVSTCSILLLFAASTHFKVPLDLLKERTRTAKYHPNETRIYQFIMIGSFCEEIYCLLVRLG